MVGTGNNKKADIRLTTIRQKKRESLRFNLGLYSYQETQGDQTAIPHL